MQEIPEIATSIKEAAELTGLTEDTIRYYEKIGLLPYADRKQNGHRIYSKDQIRSILFLTRLKATGMTIEEMKRYRALTSGGNEAIPQKISLLEEHLEKIRQEIASLIETEKVIEYKIDHYRKNAAQPELDDTPCTPAG